MQRLLIARCHRQTLMTKRRFPLAKVYGLLESGPVLLLTTAHRGESDVMAMSWHTLLEFEPPLVGAVVSDRNHSFTLLRRSRQCVLNIPTAEIADKVVGCGNTHGPEVDKFAAAHAASLRLWGVHGGRGSGEAAVQNAVSPSEPAAARGYSVA